MEEVITKRFLPKRKVWGSGVNPGFRLVQVLPSVEVTTPVDPATSRMLFPEVIAVKDGPFDSDLLFQVVPSLEVKMAPESPTTTKDGRLLLELSVVELSVVELSVVVMSVVVSEVPEASSIVLESSPSSLVLI